MKAFIAEKKDIADIRPLAEEWLVECDNGGFGLDGSLQYGMETLSSLITCDNSDLFVLRQKGRAVGFMGIKCFDSPIGDNLIADEHFLFVSKGSRGRGGIILIRAAKKWAKGKGCSHLIFNASNLASEMHDKVCRLYENMNFEKFETSFIKEI